MAIVDRSERAGSVVMRGAERETLVYALIAGGPAAVGPFAALWLRGQGVAYGYLGVSVAVPLLLRLPLYRPVASLSSRFTSDWSPVSLMCVTAGVASLICALCHGAGLALAAWCILCIAANVCTPLMDHAILAGASRDRGGELLVEAKGAGAVAYLLAVPMVGYGLQWGGPLSLPIWSGTIACVAALGARRIARRKAACAGAPGTPPASRRVPRSAGGTGDRHRFALMLAAVILIEASHGVQPLAMVHWNQRGISFELSGILWATGTLADVALLWLAAGWLKTIAPSILLMIGGIAAILRWTGFALEPALSTIFVLQALHALSFTAPCLAAVRLAREMDGERADGQLLTWATSTGMAGGIAVVIAAPLYGALGVHAYWFMTVLAGGGLILALLMHLRLGRSLPSQKASSRSGFDKSPLLSK